MKIYKKYGPQEFFLRAVFFIYSDLFFMFILF